MDEGICGSASGSMRELLQGLHGLFSAGILRIHDGSHDSLMRNVGHTC